MIKNLSVLNESASFKAKEFDSGWGFDGTLASGKDALYADDGEFFIALYCNRDERFTSFKQGALVFQAGYLDDEPMFRDCTDIGEISAIKYFNKILKELKAKLDYDDESNSDPWEIIENCTDKKFYSKLKCVTGPGSC